MASQPSIADKVNSKVSSKVVCLKQNLKTPLRGGAVSRMGRGLLDAFAPRLCALCDQYSHSSIDLCAVCRAELIVNGDACQHCAIPLPSAAVCPDCQREPPPVSRSIAPYCYDAALAYLIGRWKYHGEEQLSHTLARLWLAGTTALPERDLLLPIPLHWRRQLQRGYNQSELLLDALCRSHGALREARSPHVRLRRQRPTQPQARADRDARLRNLRGAFSLRGEVRGLRIALIDDVCTTGATANAAALALLDGGAADVQLWCIARTPAG